ncbi:MAG: hypothetical protein QM820_09885 [Minicystis sp.]
MDAVLQSLSPRFQSLIKNHARAQLNVYEELCADARSRGEPEEPWLALQSFALRHPAEEAVKPIAQIVEEWRADATMEFQPHPFIVPHLRHHNVDAILGGLPPKLRRSLWQYARDTLPVLEAIVAAARQAGAETEPWFALRDWVLRRPAALREMSVAQLVTEWREGGLTAHAVEEALFPRFAETTIDALFAELPEKLRRSLERHARERLTRYEALLTEARAKGEPVEPWLALRGWALRHPLEAGEPVPLEEIEQRWLLGVYDDRGAVLQIVPWLREADIDSVIASLPPKLTDEMARYARELMPIYDAIIAALEKEDAARSEPWIALRSWARRHAG